RCTVKSCILLSGTTPSSSLFPYTTLFRSINAGDKSLIVSMDPITGAVERIGWLSVNVNANDVATFGVEPAFLVSCLLLPEGADRDRKSTRLNSSHVKISYAVFCLKKKIQY